MTAAAPDYDEPALHAFARDYSARGPHGFAVAIRLFDRDSRENLRLLHAWWRAVDDRIADLGNDPAAVLALVHVRTDLAFAGTPTGDAAFDALGILVAKTAVSRTVIDDIITGFALDAGDWHPRGEDDLLRYCYHVAGAVGVAAALVMGISPGDDATLDRASDMGIAFQLVDIARDVAEDAAEDRCYLPMDWMVELDIPPGQHMHPAFRSRLAVMGKWLAEMAADYEASARWGARKLTPRNRWAVLAGAGIYGDIAREVMARGDHAWDHRARASLFAKLGWAARAGWSVLRRPPLRRISREGLWTRPASGVKP